MTLHTFIQNNPQFKYLAEQWHPTKNGDRTIKQIGCYTNTKVWWCLPYDVPMDYPIESLRGKHFNFEWESPVISRTKKNGKCPFLTGHKVFVGFNDLATTHPNLIGEWSSKNTFKPTEITAGSDKIVLWEKQYNGKNYLWTARISSRTYQDSGCPQLRYVKKKG